MGALRLGLSVLGGVCVGARFVTRRASRMGVNRPSGDREDPLLLVAVGDSAPLHAGGR